MREYFENEYYPSVYKCGVTDYDEFMKLTPRKISILYKGYAAKKQELLEENNRFAYLQGQYFAEALNCTVGNMFRKKGTMPIKYPKEPYKLYFRTDEEKKADELDRFFEGQARTRELWRKKHKKDITE